MNEPDDPTGRAVLAQCLGRLLLCRDDEQLARFRRQHLVGASHVTVEELRLARIILQRLGEQMTRGGAAGWRRVADAAEALAGVDGATQPHTGDVEAITNVYVALGRSMSVAPPFAPVPVSDQVRPAAPAQARTAAISDELRDQLRTVDRALCWSVDDYARLCVAIERALDPAPAWREFGVGDDRGVHAAIQVAWRDRLRDPVLKRQFEASLARHRHQPPPPGRRPTST